jgi:DNA primase
MALANPSIEDVLAAVDIVDVVSDYVELQKKGKNLVGLCPFHADSNPSMTVSPDKQIYKCFSCGAGGNAIGFVQHFEQIPFADALRKVADRAGLQVEVRAKPYQNLIKANGLAAQMYQFVLYNSKEADPVREYLSQRGVTETTMKRFGLGYAPKKPTLAQAASKQNIPVLDLQQAGLLSAESGHELFRERIMIPIEDGDGQLIGFSGRVLQGTDSKYINTPDTPIFHKSTVLYNLSRARVSAKQKNRLLLVEGYMDVFALAEQGYDEVVAVMGTAFTKDHAKQLQAASYPIYFVFDGDVAGQQAAFQSALQGHALNTYVVLLPQGNDPDEYIREHGKDAFESLLQGVVSGSEFIFNRLKGTTNIDNIHQVKTFKDSMFNYLRVLPTTAQERYLQKMADFLQVSVSSVVNDFRVPAKKPVDVIKKRDYQKYERAEKELLSLMKTSKDIAYTIDQKLTTMIKESHETIKESFMRYYQQYSVFQAEAFLVMLPQPLVEEAIQILHFSEYRSLTQLEGLFATMEEFNLQQRMQYLQRLLPNISGEERFTIAEEMRQISKKLKGGHHE